MKNLLIIICLLSSLSLYSQVSLTRSNIALEIGDIYSMNLADCTGTDIDPTPAGPSQTWDFSGVTPISEQQTSSICVSPQGTPFEDSVSNVDLCVKFKDLIQGSYQYFTIDNDAMILSYVGWYAPGNS